MLHFMTGLHESLSLKGYGLLYQLLIGQGRVVGLQGLGST